MRIGKKILIAYCGVDVMTFENAAKVQTVFNPDHILRDPSCYDITPWATKYGNYLGEDTLGFIEEVRQFASYNLLVPVFLCSRDYQGQFSASQHDCIFVCGIEGEINNRILVTQSIPLNYLLEIGEVLGLSIPSQPFPNIEFHSKYKELLEKISNDLLETQKRNKEETKRENKALRAKAR